MIAGTTRPALASVVGHVVSLMLKDSLSGIRALFIFVCVDKGGEFFFLPPPHSLLLSPIVPFLLSRSSVSLYPPCTPVLTCIILYVLRAARFQKDRSPQGVPKPYVLGHLSAYKGYVSRARVARSAPQNGFATLDTATSVVD